MKGLKEKYASLTKEYTALKRDHNELRNASQSLERRLIKVGEKEQQLNDHQSEIREKVDDMCTFLPSLFNLDILLG
jgi:chromosome segregation ATPase